MRKALLVAFAAILLQGCAYAASQTESDYEGYEIPVVVHNFVNERGSFWQTMNGTRAQRLGECSPQTTCNFKLTARASEYYRNLGVVQIGFQHMLNGGFRAGPRPVSYAETPYFDNMMVELTINRLDYYITPQINPLGGDFPKQVK